MAVVRRAKLSFTKSGNSVSHRSCHLTGSRWQVWTCLRALPAVVVNSSINLVGNSDYSEIDLGYEKCRYVNTNIELTESCLIGLTV